MAYQATVSDSPGHRYAEAHDLVGRNVATLVDSPRGQIGRLNRSFILDQSLVLLEALTCGFLALLAETRLPPPASQR
jgi:hypothetical protein